MNHAEAASAKFSLKLGVHARGQRSRPLSEPRHYYADRCERQAKVEYFRGGNKKLFSKKSEVLPGFIAGGGLNDLKGFSLTESASALTIDFKDYDPTSGRGDKLPAISLAAVTHQKGRLHVNAAASWDIKDETRSKGTQSQRIDAIFWNAVRDKTGINQTSKTKLRQSYDALPSATEKDTFRKDVYAAMRYTYNSMYTYMIGVLPRALVKYEIPYYKEVALALHPSVTEVDKLPKDYNPLESASSVKDATKAIAEKNKAIMAAWIG